MGRFYRLVVTAHSGRDFLGPYANPSLYVQVSRLAGRNRPRLRGKGTVRGFHARRAARPHRRARMRLSAARISANIATLENKGLQNRTNHRLHVRMKQRTEQIRRDVAAHRARQAAAGRTSLTTFISNELSRLSTSSRSRGACNRAHRSSKKL